MVKFTSLDSTLSALADSTRRQMVERLLKGDATISELASPHQMSMPAAMKHITKLVDAGLVERRKQGRTVTCSLRAEPLADAQEWLNSHLAFWTRRLDALDLYLAERKDDDP